MAADRAPIAVGVKVALIMQVAFTASEAGLTGQLLVCPKSPGFVPVIAIAVIVNVPGPLLVTVMLCDALVVFCG
jgi:hypothetical protein